MFDLGFVSAILPDHSLEEVISFASTHGFRCVEAMCWPVGKADRRYAGVTHIDIDRTDEDAIAAIGNLLSQKNIYLSALGYYPNILDPDTEKGRFYIAHLKSVIEAAKKLQVPVVNTFIGRDPEKSLSYNLDRFKEVWPSIIAFAEQVGITVAIENCPMLFTKDEWPGGKNLAISPKVWDQMFQTIPSDNFGLNYDPSHLVWMQMDEIAPVLDFSEKLKHIHLKDAKVYQDRLDKVGILAHPLEYHEPKLPGLGAVRWPAFFEALKKSAYRGPICIEVEDKAYEDSQSAVYEALIKSSNYLKPLLS